MLIRIGKISKDEEEYYFVFDKAWRYVKLKDKTWHSARSIRYLEGEIDENQGSLVKKVYKRRNKVVSVEYFLFEGDTLRDIQCSPRLRLSYGEIYVCETASLRIYKFDNRYFEDKNSLVDYIISSVRRNIRNRVENETIKLKGVLEGESEKAYLIKFDSKKLWVPKSIGIYYDSGDVEIPIWFAEKQGLISKRSNEIKVNAEYKKMEDEINRLIFEL
ncbi:hypothetical protein SUSAZ_04885 [Sulfolobus acidocaldarius SUSAZ]|nr:hypothetical protein SUSAZ_04885 [Sulfolobus acidocaldarius SUSAZ]